MLVGDPLGQKKGLSVGDQHHLAKFDALHTVLKCLYGLIDLHAGHGSQRHIGKL